MLAVRFVSRGISSLRPERQPLSLLPRHAFARRHRLNARTYSQDTGKRDISKDTVITEPTSPAKERQCTVRENDNLEGAPQDSGSTAEPASHDWSSNVDTSDLYGQLMEGAMEGEVKEARPRQKKKGDTLKATRLKRSSKAPTEAVVGLREHGPKQATKYSLKREDKLLKAMAPPVERTGAKAVKVKIVPGMTPEQVENAKASTRQYRRELRLKKVAEALECPPHIDPNTFAELTITKKLELRRTKKSNSPKKPDGPYANLHHISEVVKKVKSKSTAATQYNANLMLALEAAGEDMGRGGNDADFVEGGVISSADTSRMNIVSPYLCDDVLERLAPSLERHKGCDLLDINPGVGIWSTKLHDLLKPRSHILMEPDALYRGKMESLVANDPTYKYIPRSGIIWKNLLKLEEDNLLPLQTWRKLGDPELDKPNDTLLVTLNIGYYPRRTYIGFASLAHLIMHQLFTASRAHSIFQAYGQIRVLVWVYDYEKRVMLPRNLKYRLKASLEAETNSAYVHEVCGADGDNEISQREVKVNMESAKRVARKMEEAGIVTPPHRMSRLEREFQQAVPQEEVLEGEIHRSHFKECEELENGLQQRKYPWYIDPESGPVYVEDMDAVKSGQRTPTGMARFFSKEFYRWQSLRRRIVADNKRLELVERLIGKYDHLEAMWLEVSESEQPDEVKAQELQKIELAVAEWREGLDIETPMRKHEVLSAIAERRAVAKEPPILEWDRRTYEPLVNRKEEFWPHQEMALFDIVPKTVWPSLAKNNTGDYDYYDMILSCLCQNATKSIVDRLKSFAPGADEWIIPRCPSLRDVRNGGVVDLEMLNVRNMSQQMLKEVFEAFMSWPFRPTRGRLLAQMGSTGIHDEDRDDDGAM